ncbi:unnamed protein product [Calypogeia fissa]
MSYVLILLESSAGSRIPDFSHFDQRSSIWTVKLAVEGVILHVLQLLRFQQALQWEEHSLAFFQDHIQTSRLELVATAGGLMCFETDKSNQLIVCNPISKIWRLLQIPCRTIGERQASDHHPKYMNVITSSLFDFSPAEDREHGSTFRKRTTIVGLMVDPVTGNHYKIVVASLQDNYNSSCTASTVVYDSMTSSWKTGAKAPEGGEFSDGDAIFCNGSLYCLVKTETYNGELFKYDVKRDRWSALSLDMSVVRCKLIEHCGRVILAQRNSYYSHESAFKFFQLCDASSLRGCRSRSRSYSCNNSEPGGMGGGLEQDLSMKSLEETDLIESLNLDAVSVSKVLGHLTYEGRVCLLGQKNFLYVLKPPYEDGLRKKRTLVTIIDLSTGSCDVLRELIVASTSWGPGSHSSPGKHRMGSVFHLFSASVIAQV